jgi:hypothetical protein
MVVGLGAYPAGVAHTRPINVVATATDADLAQQVGFIRGRIQVPSGVGAAIERRCAEVGLPAVGLWAQVPHYASTMPFPAAGASLLEALHLPVSADLAQPRRPVPIRRLDAVADNPDARRLSSSSRPSPISRPSPASARSCRPTSSWPRSALPPHQGE